MNIYPGVVYEGWEWREIPTISATSKWWGWCYVVVYTNGGGYIQYPDITRCTTGIMHRQGVY